MFVEEINSTVFFRAGENFEVDRPELVLVGRDQPRYSRPQPLILDDPVRVAKDQHSILVAFGFADRLAEPKRFTEKLALVLVVRSLNQQTLPGVAN